jgi:hypothetical protein
MSHDTIFTAKNDQPSDVWRYMVPPIDLDHSSVNPKVAQLLRYWVYFYIRHLRLQQLLLQLQDVERASDAVLHTFDFNDDEHYDPSTFSQEMQVRTIPLTALIRL